MKLRKFQEYSVGPILAVMPTICWLVYVCDLVFVSVFVVVFVSWGIFVVVGGVFIYFSPCVHLYRILPGKLVMLWYRAVLMHVTMIIFKIVSAFHLHFSSSLFISICICERIVQIVCFFLFVS